MAIRISIYCFLYPILTFGQIVNLIPNSGFEKIIGKPEKWFYTGSDFNLVFEDWKSPTAASPDAYHSDIYVPQYWRDKGFNDLMPFKGKSMVGITMYGCNQGKLHCREYVTVPMMDALVIGQQYYFSMWVAPLQKGIIIDQIQVAFDQKPAIIMDDRRLELKPFYNLAMANQVAWQLLELRFFAETEATFLTIGNFNEDDKTGIIRGKQHTFQPFAYYYIDEVNLKKVPPILIREEIGHYDSLELEEVSIEIKNIYFDFDENRLLPVSYLELNKLLRLMTAHPLMRIKIIGHTDHIGSEHYNKTLSYRRAQAVAKFLERHYIMSNRIQIVGVGYDQPLASNQDEAGRQKNRRVVFEIVR